MKHLYMFLLVSFFICSMQMKAKSTTQHYKQLQRNRAYRGMPLIQIAAEVDDFPAITFFKTQASPNDLRNAYVTLKKKQHQLQVTLKEKPPRDIIGVARVAETKSQIQRRINLLKNMMNSLAKQIQQV